MKLGNEIQLPASHGLQPLSYTLPESQSSNRRIKIYRVPEAVSGDGYYISIIEAGAVETVPPSRAKDTMILVDFNLSGDEATVNYIDEETKNA